MKCFILFCMTMLYSAVYGIETQPFDCATPIVLGPILQYMRENLDNGASKESFLSYAKPMQTAFTIKRKSQVGKETVRFDSIDEITYDIPCKNTFRLFIDKGIVIKLQHIDGKGIIKEYNQVEREMVNQIHFDDSEYERQSKDCLFKVYMWESPFRFLHEGKHTVIINYKFKDFLGIGSVVFEEASLEYKFSFHNNIIHNVGLRSSKKQDSCILYSLTIHGGKVKSANIYDNSQLRSGFDCVFYDDMGIWMYSPMLKGVQDTVTIWEHQGKEKTVYNFDDWMKMGMPMNVIKASKEK